MPSTCRFWLCLCLLKGALVNTDISRITLLHRFETKIIAWEQDENLCLTNKVEKSLQTRRNFGYIRYSSRCTCCIRCVAPAQGSKDKRVEKTLGIRNIVAETMGYIFTFRFLHDYSTQSHMKFSVSIFIIKDNNNNIFVFIFSCSLVKPCWSESVFLCIRYSDHFDPFA